MSERVQKYLARVGFGSRREIEKWLKAGQIHNADGVMGLGDRVSIDDRIEVNGNIVIVEKAVTKTRLIAYYKREGEICTHNDPSNRPLAVDKLPSIEGGRWLSVGRLDINTSGLILFSNDGGLVHALMHPASDIEREYVCRVHGKISESALEQLIKGVKSNGEWLAFKSVHRTGSLESTNQWFNVVLTTGRNREIRRAWKCLGFEVNRLKRVRYGHYRLPKDLRLGEWRELDKRQIELFEQCCGYQNTHNT